MLTKIEHPIPAKRLQNHIRRLENKYSRLIEPATMTVVNYFARDNEKHPIKLFDVITNKAVREVLAVEINRLECLEIGINVMHVVDHINKLSSTDSQYIRSQTFNYLAKIYIKGSKGNNSAKTVMICPYAVFGRCNYVEKKCRICHEMLLQLPVLVDEVNAATKWCNVQPH